MNIKRAFWGRVESILRALHINKLQRYAMCKWVRDHLFELEIPRQFKDKEIGKIAAELKKVSEGLNWSHKKTEEEFNKFYDKCKTIFILVDKELGVKVKEGSVH